MFLFVCEQVDAGIVTLSDEQTQILQDAEVQMNSAKAQLQGTDYDRMLIYLTLPESSDETYAFTDKILEIAEKYYPDEKRLPRRRIDERIRILKSPSPWITRSSASCRCSWLCWCCSSRSTPPVCRCC